MRRWRERLKDWARILKRDAVALYLATRDPRVPWYAKALAIVIVAYALSPIDLIPDFIPVIGYLDELILLPLAIAGVLRLIEPAIMAEHRARAAEMADRPTSKLGAALIIGIWIIAIALAAWWLLGAS
jgi:uncharacterized membrane protein YkvA (DUF1232 family)